MTDVSPTAAATPDVAGLVLAGGLARRMGGGEKALIPFDGQPMIARILDRISPSCRAILINTNGNPNVYAPYGHPVSPDCVPGYAGPLAGILTGLEWLHARAETWLLSVPCDTPFLPEDLVPRLLAAAADQKGTDVVVAASAGRRHPVVALWHRRLGPSLRAALVEQDIRKIDRFTAAHRTVTVEWFADGQDPFANINSPEDLQQFSRGQVTR